MFSVFLILFGILYIVFAYRQPPKAVEEIFVIPAAFIFVREDRRIKLGRIAMGVVFIAAGAGFSLPGGKIVGAIAGVLFLTVQIAARWKIAGEVADAEDAERRMQWQSFEMLKSDQRFLHLKRYLDARYSTVFEKPSDGATYRILYADLWDASWKPLLAQNGGSARYLTAYLERKDRPARLQVCVDLQTGACNEGEVGLVGFGARIPLAPVGA